MINRAVNVPVDEPKNVVDENEDHPQPIPVVPDVIADRLALQESEQSVAVVGGFVDQRVYVLITKTRLRKRLLQQKQRLAYDKSGTNQP